MSEQRSRVPRPPGAGGAGGAGGSYAPTFISVNGPKRANECSSSEDESSCCDKHERLKKMMSQYGESMPALLRAGMVDPSVPGGARKMRQLEMKQKVMEASMRRLLRSMRDLRLREKDFGYTTELDKRRRLKLTRMIQILMLQRRNLQLQNDTLRKEVTTLTRKFLSLRKRAERLVVENINMRKFYTESRGEIDRKSIQIENLIQNKTMLQRQIQDRANLKVEIENLKFEVKRLIVENHNLKETLLNNESLLKVKVQEKEELSIENSNLRSRISKIETEDTNMKVRNEKLTNENEELRRDIQKNKSNVGEAQLLTFEYEKLKEKVNEKERELQRLESLYNRETEHRRNLHNSLQEERGNIRVLCRIRPVPESGVDNLKVLSFDKVSLPENFMNLRSGHNVFTFNHVFSPSAKQKDVFDEVKPLIISCVDGYNVCIMAYGPTGTGKTYTMQGVKEEPGVTIRVVSELLDLCQAIQSVWKITTSVSMFEIHNESIYDLLDKGVQVVKISDDGTDVRLMEANEKVAKTEQDLLFWIAKGHKRRKMAATRMNVQSSRSHLVIRVHLKMLNVLDGTSRSSSLILCDLAGSESAERIQATGDVKIETGFINRSLIALGRVFDTLRVGSMPVPFRDSKLTHLLKPCLGGHAKCVLIITVSGQNERLARSYKALQFGQNAMQVALGKTKQNTRLLSSANKNKRYTSSPSSTCNRNAFAHMV